MENFHMDCSDLWMTTLNHMSEPFSDLCRIVPMHNKGLNANHGEANE